ncbi:MAG TPA: hypothetical protein VHE61_15210 [Opitutaceae bacterium]|nr:hypothetical protein [Opitutaceae bacterium]
MSPHAAPASSATPAAPTPAPASGTALTIGLIGIAATAVGLFISGAHVVATSWLVGIAFWTAIAIGMLMMVMIHHIFDASWSTVIRRQWEHGLAAFKWLALLFLPLIVASLWRSDLVWPWMNLHHGLWIHPGDTVGQDPLYLKKSGLLNMRMFIIAYVVVFGLWIWLSSRLRKASFAQDSDGDARWTLKNRWTSGLGIPIGALTLTAAAIIWLKSLEYHWFSTMYGVWYFANCMRGALCCGVIIMVWLYRRGDYKGVLNTNHLHSIGQLMLAFTIFWAYVTFSQYFLIWNANVPEETFWYNIRELNLNGQTNQWWWVGLVLLFGHFVLPFCALLSYRFKVTQHIIRRIAFWILAIIFIDICYNVLPALKDAQGNPEPFLSMSLLWSITAAIGIGGICIWSYLRSFPTAKLFPTRDPRILESLTHHE